MTIRPITAPHRHSAIMSTITCILPGDVDALNMAKECILGSNLVTLDSEGIDLGRSGKTCIVQIGTRDSGCFLFDTLDSPPDIIAFLKNVLEDPGITKIIHDCKMDSDAFFHLWNITLSGVHDTQVCDNILRNKGEKNLNDTLSANGIQCNASRDSSVYETNPNFWATRPMTPRMIEWAAGDVSKLFQLYVRQTALVPPLKKRLMVNMSQANADRLRAMICKDTRLKCNPGLFIGKKGAGIKSIVDENSFIQFRGARGDQRIMLYAKDAMCMQELEMRVTERERAIKFA